MEYVIFDRSIFHRERFEALKSSPLKKLCTEATIVPMYTPDFVEETLMFSTVDPNSYLAQWDFIVSLSDACWFLPAVSIVMSELGRKARVTKFYLMDIMTVQRFLNRGKMLADKAIQDTEVGPLLQETRKNYEARKVLRKIRLDLRSEVTGHPPGFEQAFQANSDWMVGDVFLKHHLGVKRLLRVWRENRIELVFSEKYFKAWFATLYIPAFDQNVKVDKNDGVDGEQLSYLVWADIFVSDDRQFVPRAFNLLFPHGDKRLMTSGEFVRYLEEKA